jgi:nucleoid-associated protein YgaU
MGMTSAAEAKLDARVRPQISEMRSRTPYPRRRSDPGSEESTTPAETAVSSTALPVGVASLAAARARAGASTARRRRSSAHRAPIRLTRRGRIVVGTLIGIGVAALAALIWLAVAGQAQASGNARAGRPTAGAVTRVVVKPGQTLWGIAAKVDPGADPRVVIPQIVELNSLSSTAVGVGQVLWVPRS